MSQYSRQISGYGRRRFSAIAAALVLAALSLPPVPATAQMLCGDRTEIVRSLAENDGQTLRGTGLDVAGQVLEVWSNAEGSWIALMAPPGDPT